MAHTSAPAPSKTATSVVESPRNAAKCPRRFSGTTMAAPASRSSAVAGFGNSSARNHSNTSCDATQSGSCVAWTKPSASSGSNRSVSIRPSRGGRHTTSAGATEPSSSGSHAVVRRRSKSSLGIDGRSTSPNACRITRQQCQGSSSSSDSRIAVIPSHIGTPCFLYASASAWEAGAIKRVTRFARGSGTGRPPSRYARRLSMLVRPPIER